MKCKHCGKEQDKLLFNDEPNGEICDICFRDFFPLERKLSIVSREAAELLYSIHGDVLPLWQEEGSVEIEELEDIYDMKLM